MDQHAHRPGQDTSQLGFGWLGPVAVLSALGSALATFLVLAGLTPILPTHFVVIGVFLFNGALILLLIGIVAWQTKRLVRERRAGAAAAGLHVRIVSLFSLVAVIPAILVAVVATFTLERGLDPWFTGSIKDLMGNTVAIARSYRELQCTTLARETQLMAADINRAKVLYDADRSVFRDFMNSRSVFLGFPLTMILEPDGTVVERIEPKKVEGIPTAFAGGPQGGQYRGGDLPIAARGQHFPVRPETGFPWRAHSVRCPGCRSEGDRLPADS